MQSASIYKVLTLGESISADTNGIAGHWSTSGSHAPQRIFRIPPDSVTSQGSRLRFFENRHKLLHLNPTSRVKPFAGFAAEQPAPVPARHIQDRARASFSRASAVRIPGNELRRFSDAARPIGVRDGKNLSLNRRARVSTSRVARTPSMIEAAK